MRRRLDFSSRTSRMLSREVIICHYSDPSSNGGFRKPSMRSLSSIYPPLRLRRPQLILLCQLLTTMAVLGWVPGNWAKLATMVVIWGLGFQRLAAAELLMMAGVNVLFALINSAALARGIFRFDHPDFLG